MAIVIIVALLGGCGAETGSNVEGGSNVENSTDATGVIVFAVNVGKGDALLLRAGDWTGLVDAGKAKAMGRVRTALKGLGVSRLNGVFLTHTDDDHAGGLEWLANSDIAVDAWYASAMYTGVKPKKHPMALAAALRGEEVKWLKRGDSLPLGDSGATLRVLAPATLYDDKDDNNSLVMMLDSADGKILLAGDMELPEEAELLSFGDDLSCAVLKVANHADDDTTSEAFARATSAQIAVVSTDGMEKPGTPDPDVVARLEAVGSRVVVTEDSGIGLWIALKGGEATVSDVDFSDSMASGPYVAGVDADDDRVAVGNNGSETVDLGGFYLYSDRGDELFAFPEGTTLAPGAYLIVGATDTDGKYDLLWNDKKVIHKKKTDVITLYDACGRVMDSGDNGK